MFQSWFSKRFPNLKETCLTRSVLESLLKEAWEEGYTKGIVNLTDYQKGKTFCACCKAYVDRCSHMGD